MQFRNGQYAARLPWNCDIAERDLPANYNFSLQRLTPNLRKLRGDPDSLRKYHEVIEDQGKRGYIDGI